MEDRVRPSAKPANSNPQPPKSQLYNLYRQKPRSPRPTCSLCCIWSSVFLLALILLAAIAAGAVWLLYRPQLPSFSISTLKFAAFNLTTGSAPRLNSLIDLSRNPNKKIVFFYDPISIAVSSDSGLDIGDGGFQSFMHGTRNTTTLKVSVSSGGARDLDSAAAESLSSKVQTKKNQLPLEIRFETKFGVKMGGLKTKKVGIRVLCSGINASIPKGNSKTVSSSASDVECEVKLRMKIWKWYI